jgi:hypothetical protein
VLSEREREIWTEIERAYRAEASPPRRGVEDVPLPIVAVLWGSLLLVAFGAPVAGLVLGALTGVGLLVWRVWPEGDGPAG